MLRHGYNGALRGGTVAGSSVLGYSPPSVLFIIYALITEHRSATYSSRASGRVCSTAVLCAQIFIIARGFRKP
jgi:TRAP-type C4-dicarboxylate transport system permease large subunit